MLPKKNRVDKKGVEKIFKEGRFVNAPSLTFKFILEKNKKNPQISFIVPKNIAKLAAKRNNLRRMGYNVLKKQIKYFPLGLRGVFVFKKKEESPTLIEDEIEKIQHKIN